MSTSKIHIVLLVVLHGVSWAGLICGGMFLSHGFYLQGGLSTLVGMLFASGILLRDLKLQEENERFMGDYLDSITPTIQSGPPPAVFASKLPPVTTPPNKVPNIQTWHGKRGSA
jgi:hypothetical protein